MSSTSSTERLGADCSARRSLKSVSFGSESVIMQTLQSNSEAMAEMSEDLPQPGGPWSRKVRLYGM